MSISLSTSKSPVESSKGGKAPLDPHTQGRLKGNQEARPKEVIMRKSIAVAKTGNPTCQRCGKSLEFIKNVGGFISKKCGCK